VDVFVLCQTIRQYYAFELRADTDVFQVCYKPQLIMRIIFTAYAINAAGLCFVLTLGLSLFNDEERIEKLALNLFHYTYIAFGPVLFLLCCAFGLPNIPGLVYRCELTHINRE
jgi:hypothetical protein